MATRLQESFHAVYKLLEWPRPARRAVAGLLVIHTLLLGYSAYVHSPTLNEPAHLVAGLSHWKFGRFDVYRVNPPLVRMVAALPVMAVGYQEDWNGFYEGPGARPEARLGKDFVAANGERSFFLLMIARWASIPFSWIGAIVCYLWARDLFARPAGVFAATIWCFEPNILGHASLITPDAHATALGVAACYTFWRWLKKPTWGQAALAGVVLGLAELTKLTLIIFYPLWPVMWFIYRWPDRRQVIGRDWLRQAGMLALQLAIGVHILNFGYGFEGSFTRLKDFQFVSDLFRGNSKLGAAASQSKAWNPAYANRFAKTWVGELPIPIPQNCLSGIDLQQKDFEHYDRPSYFLGKWRERGWWYYYLYACAIKVPLGLWLMGLLTLNASTSTLLRKTRADNVSTRRQTVQTLNEASQTFDTAKPEARDKFILIFPATILLTVVSANTGINEHMRYVMPIFPYFYIAVSRTARFALTTSKGFPSSLPTLPTKCLTTAPQTMRPPVWQLTSRTIAHSSPMTLILSTRVPILGAWLIASSLFVYPHSLAYFNESIGGPLNGPKHLLGSNFDWGQDLIYLKSWQQSHKQLDPFRLVYYGCFDPADVGVHLSTLPTPLQGLIDFDRLERGYYALSTCFEYGTPWYIYGRNGRIQRYQIGAFSRFRVSPTSERISYTFRLIRIP
jgi:hypothetical protein